MKMEGMHRLKRIFHSEISIQYMIGVNTLPTQYNYLFSRPVNQVLYKRLTYKKQWLATILRARWSTRTTGPLTENQAFLSHWLFELHGR